MPPPSRDFRLRGFLWHLAAYAAAAVLFLVIDYAAGGGLRWSVFFVVAWGAPLAIHVAWVMRLFGGGH